jgi:hypothetical protein
VIHQLYSWNIKRNSRPARYQLTAPALVSLHGHHDEPAAHRQPETGTLFILSEAEHHKANADIQYTCARIGSNFSFCPKQNITRPTRTFSARVRVSGLTFHSVRSRTSQGQRGYQCACACITCNSSFRPKRRLDLSRSMRTFPCVCATLQRYTFCWRVKVQSI